MENKIIVAIDGYSSCGKSTIAKALAKHAGYTYVDTGAMYRATALYAQRAGLGDSLSQIIPLLSNIQISFILTPNGQHVTLNGEALRATTIRHTSTSRPSRLRATMPTTQSITSPISTTLVASTRRLTRASTRCARAITTRRLSHTTSSKSSSHEATTNMSLRAATSC